MSVGLIGQKRGMTRMFTEDGQSIPVTVIEVTPNVITQIKTKEVEGYTAVQVTAGSKKPSRVTKPMAGHFSKASVAPGAILKEFRVSAEFLSTHEVGDKFDLELLEEGQCIDVQSVSKGKGFQGGVKRHHFRMQDATHGNSLSHRALGSVGQCQTPGRVFKGKKMPGQMGNVKRTAVNQQVVKIDKENNLLLVKGAIPGAPGGYVFIKSTVKMVRGEK